MYCVHHCLFSSVFIPGVGLRHQKDISDRFTQHTSPAQRSCLKAGCCDCRLLRVTVVDDLYYYLNQVI